MSKSEEILGPTARGCGVGEARPNPSWPANIIGLLCVRLCDKSDRYIHLEGQEWWNLTSMRGRLDLKYDKVLESKVSTSHRRFWDTHLHCNVPRLKSTHPKIFSRLQLALPVQVGYPCRLAGGRNIRRDFSKFPLTKNSVPPYFSPPQLDTNLS